MSKSISIQDKKHFISWFRDHCQLKNRQSGWILDYLLQNDHLLTNIHFVNDVINYPKGIMMTSIYSDGADFRFHKKHIATNDIDKPFHEMRLHPNERMYIQINCKQANNNYLYASILEDHYFAHENKAIKQVDQERAEEILNQVKYRYHKKQLQNQINLALEEKNKEKFIQLSKEWNAFIKE